MCCGLPRSRRRLSRPTAPPFGRSSSAAGAGEPGTARGPGGGLRGLQLDPGSDRMVPRTRVGRSALRAAAPAVRGRSRAGPTSECDEAAMSVKWAATTAGRRAAAVKLGVIGHALAVGGGCCSTALRSPAWRTRSTLGAVVVADAQPPAPSQLIDRSTFQRWRFGRSDDSASCRAIRTLIPRWARSPRQRRLSYALSAWTLWSTTDPRQPVGPRAQGNGAAG